MRNKIKIAIATCIGCILLLGGALTVFAAGSLTIAVSSSTVAQGDTMTVTVYAVGANNEEVTADMNITYDSARLEYVSASGGNASGGGGTVKATGSTVDVKFKAIASGDAYVKAEGATLTAAGTHITVSGSSSPSSAADEKTETNTALSGDNSLSSLKISPGTLSPAFKGSTTNYTATVGSDVNEITVTPVTSNSKATVESITGNTNLKSGENVISILVKAENGTEAAYKITVTKTDTAANSDTDTTDTVSDSTTDQTDTSGTEDAQASAAGDAIVIDGVTYRISDDFSDSDIPEGFIRADFEYKGAPHKGISYEHGHLGMYYLVNDAGEGRFFVYDADRDGFYPYVRLSSGEHYIILMVVPNGVIPPENYEETTLTLDGSVAVQAYQYAGETDEEILNFDNTEAVEGTETANGTAASGYKSDFYIFYGMDDTGVSGWYQYDIQQGTYQRLNEEAVGSSDNKESYQSLLDSYNELSDRHKATKAKDRRLIAVLIFISVVLLIIIVNLILKLRDQGDDEDDDDHDMEFENKKQNRKEKPVRAGKMKFFKPEDDSDFYEDDSEDIMGEFEDEPVISVRKNRKKEKITKERKTESRKPEAETVIKDSGDDDDIEFLDLNDL